MTSFYLDLRESISFPNFELLAPRTIQEHTGPVLHLSLLSKITTTSHLCHCTIGLKGLYYRGQFRCIVTTLGSSLWLTSTTAITSSSPSQWSSNQPWFAMWPPLDPHCPPLQPTPASPPPSKRLWKSRQKMFPSPAYYKHWIYCLASIREAPLKKFLVGLPLVSAQTHTLPHPARDGVVLHKGPVIITGSAVPPLADIESVRIRWASLDWSITSSTPTSP